MRSLLQLVVVVLVLLTSTTLAWPCCCIRWCTTTTTLTGRVCCPAAETVQQSDEDASFSMEDNYDRCHNVSGIDAAIYVGGDKIVFFAGAKTWEQRATSEQAKEVNRSKRWKGLPPTGAIDAAFSTAKGDRYFFIGTKYWKFDADGQLLDDYPKLIKSSFAIDGPFDAAMQRNNKLYIIKGRKVYVLEPKRGRTTTTVTELFVSKKLKSVDAVVYLPNHQVVYVFSKGNYYRSAPRSFQLNEPKSLHTNFFGCEAADDLEPEAE